MKFNDDPAMDARMKAILQRTIVIIKDREWSMQMIMAAQIAFDHLRNHTQGLPADLGLADGVLADAINLRGRLTK